MLLAVEKLPEFVTPLNNVQAAVGSEAVFEVEVAGEPGPEVTW